MRKNVIMPAVCEICPEMHFLAKVANLTKDCQTFANIQMRWQTGPMPRSDFDKYDEFGKDSPKFWRKCKGDGVRGP